MTIEGNVSRRWAIFRLGRAAAASAAVLSTATIPAPAVPVRPNEPQELPGYFEHPSEYLAAMQSIGWRPVAMYQRLEGGGIHCMGVNEYGGGEENITETWGKYHAISMRMPVQRASDMPQGKWWSDVWQYLYDKGLREDVTPERVGGAS
ncbi:MAG: hypothetical protein J0H78_20165 [Rhizobiales bacterium]|nr:hypothetical protein [Hyphomicrobiales bacterium]